MTISDHQIITMKQVTFLQRTNSNIMMVTATTFIMETMAIMNIPDPLLSHQLEDLSFHILLKCLLA